METKIRIFAILASVLMLTIVAVPMVAARRTQPITTFEDAIRIAERFLQVNPDGTLILNMPIRMVRSIGRDHYAQLQAGIAQTNKMISQGYLKVGENFDVYVTEKYLDKVKANAILYQESYGISASDISISKSGNSITTIGILGGGAGENKVTWYWWGFIIYWCSETVDGINKGTISISMALNLIGITAGMVGKVVFGGIVLILGAMVGGAGSFLAALCDGRGVRLTFRYIPLPPPLLPIILTDARPQ